MLHEFKNIIFIAEMVMSSESKKDLNEMSGLSCAIAVVAKWQLCMTSSATQKKHLIDVYNSIIAYTFVQSETDVAPALVLLLKE